MDNTTLIKRMGFGKNADLKGMGRGDHFGDSKRTRKSIAISRKNHTRKAEDRRNSAILDLNYNTELYSYYGPEFLNK